MTKKSAGLTIAETMVSLTLLSLLLVGVLTVFPSSMSLVGTVRTGREARLLAQNQIEQMASRPFGSLALGQIPATEVHLADGTEVLLESSISPVAGVGVDAPIKHLRCQASWMSKSKVSHVEVREVYVHGLRR
jgi:Tfp pilus assembly protein PilV